MSWNGDIIGVEKHDSGLTVTYTPPEPKVTFTPPSQPQTTVDNGDDTMWVLICAAALVVLAAATWIVFRRKGAPVGGKVWGIVKNVLAVIVGWGVHLGVLVLSEMIISALAKIPVIGAILYWPADTSWALMVLPPVDGVFAAAFVSCKIAGTQRPTCIVIAVYWALAGLSLLLLQGGDVPGRITLLGMAVVAIVNALLMSVGKREKAK